MAKNYNDESGRKKTNNSIVKELERLERLRNEHRGEWITIEVQHSQANGHAF